MALTCCPCQAQDILAPRFFRLNIQQLGSSSNLASQHLKSVPVGDNDRNFLIDASLKYPIKLSGDLQLIGSFGYKRETVFGLYSSAEEEEEGEDISLHSAKSALMFSYALQPHRKLSGRFSWSSNSSRLLSLDPRAATWSASMLYQSGRGKNQFGYGLVLALGRKLNILPLLLWQKELGRGLALDLLLPSKALLTKKIKTSSQLFGGVKAQTAGYFVEENITGFGAFEANYRRITAQAVLGYENMWNKWAGFECSIGLNLPFVSGIYSFDRGWHRLHNFQDRIAPQLKAGVFLAFDRK